MKYTNKNIDIVFITDDNFILPTLVAIQSLFANKNNTRIYNIYILLHNCKSAAKRDFDIFNSENFVINIIELNQNVEQFTKDNFPVSPTAIFKFKLPSILNKIEKVLYIDVDVIIQSDLTELFDIDLKDNYACVVKDFHGLTFKGDVFKRLKISQREGYFNSGMMLLNLKLMRFCNIESKLMEYRKNGINYYMDQDALNVVFGNNISYIDFKFNTTTTNVRNKNSKELSSYYNIEYSADKYRYIQRAHIVHFTSSDKPWVYYDSLYSDIWYYYFNLFSKSSIYLSRTSLNNIINKKDISAKSKRIQHLDNFKSNLFAILNHRENELPLVSVIIAAYNAENTISDTLNSCINQTLKSFEVICVDDGSTDNTLEILNRFSQKDHRIKVIQQKNKYAGTARNNGISKATGMFITFIDSDDIFSRDALEQFYITAISTGADVVCCNTYRFTNDIKYATETHFNLRDEYLPVKNTFPSQIIMPFIFNFTTGGVGGKFFRHEFINKHNLVFSQHPKSEDMYFIHYGLLVSETISTIKKPLYFIRTVETSLEHTKARFPLAFYDATIALKEKIVLNGHFNNQIKQSLANVLLDRFAYNLKTVNDECAYAIILKKLIEVCDTELCINEYPPKYFYNPLTYKYICNILDLTTKKLYKNCDRPIGITTSDERKNRIAKILKVKNNILNIIDKISSY